MSARNPPRVPSVMVPELLQSFPAPPSFIPPSPRTPLMSGPPSSSSSSSVHTNPPPTLPPTGPLPPLPTGRSPITEEETLLFLSSTSRLKRLSRLSINSTSSRRDSTATTTSVISNGSTGGGVPGLSPSMSGSSISSSSSSSTSSARIRTESITSSHSLRSYPSSSSLSLVSSSATHPHRHPASADKSPPVRLLPPMEISIMEEDDGISASADLTAVTLDFLCSDMDEDNGFAQFPVPPQSVPSLPVTKSKKSSPPPSSFKSPPPVTTSTRPQPFPNRESTSSPTRGRISPDIQTILSETPKPRRHKSSLLSNSSSREQSRSRASSLKRQPQRSSAPSAILGQTSASRPAVTRKLSLPEGRDESTSDLDVNELDIDQLERKLEGDGTESDSSLDLHTPFAHVMLRDGLISPRSKVISSLDTSTRPGSTMSNSSTRKKAGLFKDERDTLKRRTRHRDGRLLRGGVGLTTGLGWSDSEDEDSPSPLTRRLSSMALSRSSSFVSLRSQSGTGPPSVTRSHSTVSGDGVWMKQPSIRPSILSMASSASTRLPSTREDEDMEPPPLPPKDSLRTQSLPTRRPQPSLPSTPSPRTLTAKPSLKSVPGTSEFGVIDRSQSLSSGPRPLKLMGSSSMLRSSSWGTSPGSRIANSNSMSNPATGPTKVLDSRNRTRSVPSSTTVSPSPLLKSSKSLSKPVSVPPSSIPQVSSPLQDPSKPKSRIGTGMIYKKSNPTVAEFALSSGLRKPMVMTTGGIGGGVKGRGSGLPSPLRTGAGSSGGSSPASSSVEFGIAL